MKLQIVFELQTKLQISRNKNSNHEINVREKQSSGRKMDRIGILITS